MTMKATHNARARFNLKNGIVVLLLLSISMPTCLGLIGEARAQTKLARVGILTFSSIAEDPRRETLWMEPLRRNLSENGWVENKNVSFEYRSANSDPSKFAEAAAALVALKVDVILAASAPALRAAYAATRTIPIVAIDLTTDPIVEGYVESYARPGGNVTGIFLDAPEFAGKWFELLNEVVPNLSRVSALWDPAPGPTHMLAVRDVAKSLNIELDIIQVRKPDDLDKAFATMRGRPQAVILLPSPMIYWQNARLAGLALKHRLPATSMAVEFANAGGLLAYGPELTAKYHHNAVAVMVAKILSDANPAELPVERPTNIQLIVNLKTAKTLGITVPQSILLRADEVIR